MVVSAKKSKGKKAEGKRKEYFMLIGGGASDIEKCLGDIKLLVDKGFSVEDKKWKVYEDKFYNFLAEIAEKKEKSVVPYMNEYERLRSACIRNADIEREEPDFLGEFRIAKSNKNHYNGSRGWRK